MRSVGFIVLAVLAAVVTYEPRAMAGDQSKLVLVPLSSLGPETSSKKLRSLSNRIATEIKALESVQLLSPQTIKSALAKANRPGFSGCDGRSSCLAELGKVVEADQIVFGEVGGLGGAQVIYLKLVIVKDAVFARSTTLELSNDELDAQEIKAAVTRLLAPKRYSGSLSLKLDVKGASVYIDGNKMRSAPGANIPLPVGSHAVRATHPEFRDFVRFVDIEFGKTATVTANMQQFPIVASQIRRNPTDQPASAAIVTTKQRAYTPWYRRWYTVAAVGTTAFVASAVVFALLADGVDADLKQNVDVPEF